MSLFAQIRDDLKGAMQSGDKVRLGTLRMLVASIKNKEIEERKKEVGLADEEVLGVIQREAKKRKDAIAEYEKAARGELVRVEAEELAILETYLPAELSDEEVKRIVLDGIHELGPPDAAVAVGDAKQLGALMKVIMPTLKGRASGDRILRLARQALGAE